MNNRITTWLLDEDLANMDAHISSSSQIKSRSEFIRVACAEYINNKMKTKFEGSNEVVLTLSDKLLTPINYMVMMGLFDSREEACRHLIRDGFENHDLRRIKENLSVVDEMSADVAEESGKGKQALTRYNTQ